MQQILTPKSGKFDLPYRIDAQDISSNPNFAALADLAFEHFMTHFSAEETANNRFQAEVILGVGALCAGFARTMQSLGSPADRLVHKVVTDQPDGSQLKIKTTYPGWIVHEDSYLTGENTTLFHVQEDFRGLDAPWQYFNTPDEFTDFKERHRLSQVLYQTTGLFVAATGEIMPLRKSYNSGRWSNEGYSGWRWAKWKITRPYVTPEDLLGKEYDGSMSAQAVVRAMDASLKAASATYKSKHDKQSLQARQRPFGYYEPTQKTQEVPAPQPAHRARRFSLFKPKGY